MKIERPVWCEFVGTIPTSISYDLNKWFDTHVEPINKMLSKGVEVHKTSGSLKYCWLDKPIDAMGFVQGNYPTHKALLINIEPIKQETAEDILRDVKDIKHISHYHVDIVKRIEALLEKK